jgi:pimeloyl-ACP methyl ester carboxylesterase
MLKPLIVFSHANSFPAGSYRVLFEHWQAKGFEVQAIEKFGHDARFPVSSNWPHLRDQLLQFVDTHRQGRKVHLVGHSLGGLLSLLAACRRPEWVASVVLIDSPLLTGWKAKVVRVAKAAGVFGRMSPGRVSQRRRTEWKDREAAHSHFVAKPMFARFHAQALKDYLAAGLQEHKGGVRLSFSREVETQLYNTLPHHFGALLRRRPPQCPVAYLGGKNSHEGRLVGLSGLRRLCGERIEWFEGTHLFPFERPAQTAQAVLRWVQAVHSTAAPKS